MPEKAEFFQEATCQLLNTFNLREGLERLQTYIGNVLPCGEIRLSCFPSLAAAPAKNIHIRARGGSSSIYYGAPLTSALMDTLLSLEPTRGEIITSPEHPLVLFCKRLNASGHGLMPLPWYDLTLWENGDLIGECRFSGWQEKPFTREDCELLDSLRPVLCIALSNYKKYMEIKAFNNSVKKENLKLKQALTGFGNIEIVGALSGLKQVMERARLVARHDVPVLICGETGTGKELIARAIHALSPRAKAPFIAINCGATPSSLIDSELFGYAKGAFTGAVRNYKGYFERAEGGTFFLDEVGELPLEAQARLLRALQEREIQPLGSEKTRSVNVRIVAATNRNLPELAGRGLFRADLYYRLRCAHILLPPLRERREDIPELARHILLNFVDDSGISMPVLDKNGLDALKQYDWPGNIRELQNVVMEAAISTPPGMPMRFNLDGGAMNMPETGIAAARPLTSNEALASHYARVLDSCGWRIKGENGAAAILGVNPSTLRFRLKKLGLLGTAAKTRR